MDPKDAKSLNPRAIFSKTGKGVQEASGKTSHLSRADRAVLAAVDGKTPLSDISAKFDKLSAEKFDALIQQLDKDGFVREVSSGQSAAPTPRPSAPAAKAPPKTPPPADDGDDMDFTQAIKLPPKGSAPAAPKPPSIDLAAAARAEAERKLKDQELDYKARQEAELKARAAAEAKAKAEAEARARAAAEAEAKTRAEAEAKVKAAREAAVRMATEAKAKSDAAEREKARVEAELNAKLDAERKAREDAERRAAEAAEQARKELEDKAKRDAEEMRQRLEAEMKAKLDAERKAREEEDRKRREEEDRKRKEEDERRAKEDAERRAKEDAERRAREEADRKKREEEDRKRKEDDERRAKEEAARKAREEADRKKREEDDRKRKEEDERRAKEAAERRAKEQAEQRAREEAERKKRDEEERKRREDDDRRRKEDDERRAKEDAERKAKDEAEAKARAASSASMPAIEPAAPPPPPPAGGDLGDLLGDLDNFGKQEEEERKAKEEEERKAKETAARRAKEAAESKAREEAEAKRREEDERRRKAEEEQRANEEAERKAREEEERKSREEKERRKQEEEEAERKREAKAALAANLGGAQAAKSAAGAARDGGDVDVQDEDVDLDDIRRDSKVLAKSAAAREPVSAVVAATGRPKRWGKPVAIAVFALLVVGIGVLHVMPVSTADYEKGASEALGVPVKIGSARMSVITGVELKFENVAIGDGTKIRLVRGSPDIGSLFGARKSFSRVELEGVSMAQSQIADAVLGKAAGANFRVGRVMIKQLTLDGPLKLPPLDVDAAVSGDGTVQSVRLTGDEKLSVQLSPKGSEMAFEISAGSLALPFVPALSVSEFGMKGTANRGGVTSAEFDGRAYDGVIKGTARIRWGGTWNVDGTLSARNMKIAVFAPTLVSQGKVEGEGKFAMSGADAGKLYEEARLEGNFKIENGVIGNFNLRRALETGGAQTGGRTEFAEMTGQGVYERGAVQLRNLAFSSGAMNANASVDIAANGGISGRIAAEVKTPNQTLRAVLNISGKVQDPVIRK